MKRSNRVAKTLGLSLALLIGTGSAAILAQTTTTSSSKTAAAPAAAPATNLNLTATSTTAASSPAAAEVFSKEQLEQLVAPIALYSDSLLTQILMASTYPIEIVQADRWVRANPKVKDAALEAALKEKDWDPSVKGLCTLPDVLKMMSENLEWTQDLGDAFLGQKSELLDTVQIMRGKAHDSGNLKSTEQQVVTVKEEKIIVIESASPEVVYVPTYSPTVVYGGWSYPSYYYPPMYPYYPPGAGLVTFGVGMAVGAAIWGDCNWGWGHNDVNIDVDRYNNFNRNTNVDHRDLSGSRGNWNHDASHRGGVNYKNSQVASKYGAKSGTNRVSGGQAKAQAQARGYSGASAGTRQARTPSASTQARTGSAGQGASRERSATASQRSGQRPSTSSSTRSGSYGGSSGKSAYSGSSRPSYDRASSSRGASSRGSTSYGGASRGGGGMRGGGGGGRRR